MDASDETRHFYRENVKLIQESIRYRTTLKLL